MAKQYWVGEFYVDLSRNQISQLGQSQTLPPKALQVLTLLAENRGKVVSYDELLDTVWANSVVTPNTLQRCIAQLRKALGENSKVPDIIKTHAKQGYSLECDVSWSVSAQPLEDEGQNDEADIHSIVDEKEPDTYDPVSDDISYDVSAHSDSTEQTSDRKWYWLAAFAATVIIAWVFFGGVASKPQFQFGEFRYLTATDDKEYGGTYSPDGKYILFHRYYEQLCLNNIWAKNAETLEEIQLTKELGTYSGQSLSADGKTLVFIQRDDCTKPVTQNFCFRLMSLDFQAALRERQTPTELLRCENSKIKMPIWIGEKQVAMLQKEAQPWRLIRFSMEDKSTSILYEFEGGSILHYTFSPERKMFAVTSMKDGGQQYIDMLTLDGEVISSYPITIPSTAPRHMIVRPEFIPGNDKLIFGDGAKLYSLSQQGEINQEDFRLDESFGAPYFHPDGSRLLLIKGRYDGDLARVDIEQAKQSGQRGHVVALSAFERSFNSEDYAKFQPNGEQIAFASKKTGSMQVWLVDQNGAKMLSNLPRGTGINNLFWDEKGEGLLLLAEREMVLLGTDGKAQPYDFTYPVTELFHWDSESQTAAANILVNGVRKFVEIDLGTLQYRRISEKYVNWAAKNNEGVLLFTDHLDRFWLEPPGAAEEMLLEALSEQGSEKRFVINKEMVYGINKQQQLWSYNLESDVFTILSEMQTNVDYLTDVNDEAFLLTFVVAAKKEVVEVSVK